MRDTSRPSTSRWRRRRALLTPAAVIAASALALAGCGTSPVRTGPDTEQPAGTASTARGTGGTTDPGAAPAHAVRDRSAASALAEALLGRLGLPPGAEHTGRAPVSVLERAPELPATPDLAQATRFALSTRSVRDTARFFERHPAAGVTPRVDSGVAGGPGGVTERWVDEPLGNLPAGVESAQLLVSVAPLPAGGSGIRVDAQVTWVARRPSSSRVPARDRFAVVSVLERFVHTEPVGQQLPPPRQVVVTDPTEVQALRDAANGLQTAPRGVTSCPADTGTRFVVAFATSVGSPPDVSFRAGGCDQVFVTSADGRPIAVLASDQAFVSAYQSVLDRSTR